MLDLQCAKWNTVWWARWQPPMQSGSRHRFSRNLILSKVWQVENRPKYARQKCENDRVLPSTSIWVVRPAVTIFEFNSKIVHLTFDPEQSKLKLVKLIISWTFAIQFLSSSKTEAKSYLASLVQNQAIGPPSASPMAHLPSRKYKKRPCLALGASYAMRPLYICMWR